MQTKKTHKTKKHVKQRKTQRTKKIHKEQRKTQKTKNKRKTQTPEHLTKSEIQIKRKWAQNEHLWNGCHGYLGPARPNWLGVP